MKETFNKIKTSFIKSTNGEEEMTILIRYWGIVAYVFTYFILNKLIINNSHSSIVNSFVALLCVIYFSWHLYAMIKSSPKKPKLSKEERKEINRAKRKEFFSHLGKKLLLQESFSKWDPIFVTKLVDLFCIANFFGLFLD